MYALCGINAGGWKDLEVKLAYLHRASIAYSPEAQRDLGAWEPGGLAENTPPRDSLPRQPSSSLAGPGLGAWDISLCVR